MKDDYVLEIALSGRPGPIVAACAHGLAVEYCKLIMHVLLVVIKPDRDPSIFHPPRVRALMPACFIIRDDPDLQSTGVGRQDFPRELIVGDGEYADINRLAGGVKE